MNTKEVIRKAVCSGDLVATMYLSDLSDADLLVRPVEGANHIAWQLGHLIISEHDLIEAALPGSMPKLPDGFRERYTKETATLDDAKVFHTKAEYERLGKQLREGTLAALDKIAESELDKLTAEEFRAYAPTVADLFMLQGPHILMHAGQWAIVRRKLGRAPMF